MKKYDVAILGAGSWGSAVAIHLARSGKKVVMWGHRPSHIEQLKQDRCNQKYLPDVPFPQGLDLESDIIKASDNAKVTVLAVPSHVFAETLAQLPKGQDKIAWLTKGIEPSSLQLLHEVVLAHSPETAFAVISGPSFAKEVANNLPTALCVAGNSDAFSQELQALMHANPMRVYISHDYCGVEMAGAMKNVIAIGVGISDGLGFGANARAALITRGLKEISALGLKLGASEKTFMGLSGLGDLLLTATDNLSRNRRFGLKLGQGLSFTEAQNEIGQVVEGRFNAKQVNELARIHQLTLPICQHVNDILQETMSAQEAVNSLLNRPPAYE